jgi:hypothetical protein
MPARLLATLAEIYGREIMPEKVMAYIARIRLTPCGLRPIWCSPACAYR